MGNKQDVIRNHDMTVMQAGFSLGTLCCQMLPSGLHLILYPVMQARFSLGALCQMLPSGLHLILYPFMWSKGALQCAAVYTCT